MYFIVEGGKPSIGQSFLPFQDAFHILVKCIGPILRRRDIDFCFLSLVQFGGQSFSKEDFLRTISH